MDYSCYLQKRRPEKNGCRFYRIPICASVFDGWPLVRGRTGSARDSQRLLAQPENRYGHRSVFCMIDRTFLLPDNRSHVLFVCGVLQHIYHHVQHDFGIKRRVGCFLAGFRINPRLSCRLLPVFTCETVGHATTLHQIYRQLLRIGTPNSI